MPSNPARRPTLADVAARAGVSVALASIVLRGAKGASEATGKRVTKAAQELGYRPDSRARLLRSSRSRLLGVQFDLHQPFHADLVEALYAAAERAGYQLALGAVTPGRGERQAAEALLADRCEALILLSPHAPTAELAALAAQLPVVSVTRRLRPRVPGVDVVRAADDDGARQTVDHLVSLGHRAIAHVDGGRAPGAADRRRGYRTAMQRHGLADQVRLIQGGFTEEHGARAARELLAEGVGGGASGGLAEGAFEGGSGGSAGEMPEGLPGGVPTASGEPAEAGSGTVADGVPGAAVGGASGSPVKEVPGTSAGRTLPTALFVFNDHCATGVLDTFLRAGVRVPDDVSVAGYDNSRLARLAHVDLTTVGQEVARMAELAVRRAVERAEGAGAEREVVIAPGLIARGTTGPPRG